MFFEKLRYPFELDKLLFGGFQLLFSGSYPSFGLPVFPGNVIKNFIDGAKVNDLIEGFAELAWRQVEPEVRIQLPLEVEVVYIEDVRDVLRDYGGEGLVDLAIEFVEVLSLAADTSYLVAVHLEGGFRFLGVPVDKILGRYFELVEANPP